MGHLNLIAEETVKLLERYPDDIGKGARQHMPQPEWDQLVEELHVERQKEAGPLAGGRPQMNGFGGHMNGGGGGAGSGGVSDDNTFASYLSSQIGNQYDDDDSDEESSWITSSSQANRGHDGGFEDSFQPAQSGSGDDFDDDWGPFASSSSDPPASAEPASNSSPFGQNLTSADWAAEFHREAAANSPSFLTEELSADSGDMSPSLSAGDDPFVDVFEADTGEKEPRVNLGRSPLSPTRVPSHLRRLSSTSSNSSDNAAAQASDSEQPLGPGIDVANTEASVSCSLRSSVWVTRPFRVELTTHNPALQDGMLTRIVDDGLGGKREVRVPLDDVALALASETGAEEEERRDEDAPVREP